MIEVFKTKKNCPIIGHNMMYDVIYFYNQFIGPLPETYEEFVKLWYDRFPLTFDTKVLSYNADYFGKTILGKIYEKCEADKRLKDILYFQFDLNSGFGNYYGAAALSHYHEAAYDAYMTGYVYAKILKYKEIDELHHSNKLQRANNKKHQKSNKSKGDAQEDSIITDPQDLKNTQVIYDHHFPKCLTNKVMMNQFDNCSCFHLNPDKPCVFAALTKEKQKDLIWIKFKETFNVDDLSAETIAQMFSNFGDYQVYKDTQKSCIINFFYYDVKVVGSKSIQGLLELLKKPESMDKYYIDQVCTYDQAPKFVAHNHFE